MVVWCGGQCDGTAIGSLSKVLDEIRCGTEDEGEDWVWVRVWVRGGFDQIRPMLRCDLLNMPARTGNYYNSLQRKINTTPSTADTIVN